MYVHIKPSGQTRRIPKLNSSLTSLLTTSMIPANFGRQFVVSSVSVAHCSCSNVNCTLSMSIVFVFHFPPKLLIEINIFQIMYLIIGV